MSKARRFDREHGRSASGRDDHFCFLKSGPVQTGRPPLGEGAVSRRSRFRLCDWDPKSQKWDP
jgi:hypothetical protein